MPNEKNKRSLLTFLEHVVFELGWKIMEWEEIQQLKKRDQGGQRREKSTKGQPGRDAERWRSPFSLRYNNIEIRRVNNATVASKYSRERKSQSTWQSSLC